MTDEVTLYHPQLTDTTVTVSPDAADEWLSQGWLSDEPNGAPSVDADESDSPGGFADNEEED